MNPSEWKVQTGDCPGGHYESVNETHIPRTTTCSVLFVLQIVTQGNHTPSHGLLRKGVNVHDFSLVRTGTNQVQQDYQVDLMGFYYESIPCPKQSQSRHPFRRVRRMGEDSGCDHFILKVYRPTTIGLHGMDQGLCAKTHEKINLTVHCV